MLAMIIIIIIIMTGYPFQGSCRLHPHQTVNGGKECREVSTLLEASLQVHLLLLPLRLL